jgi:hypothetical protein
MGSYAFMMCADDIRFHGSMVPSLDICNSCAFFFHLPQQQKTSIRSAGIITGFEQGTQRGIRVMWSLSTYTRQSTERLQGSIRNLYQREALNLDDPQSGHVTHAGGRSCVLAPNGKC